MDELNHDTRRTERTLAEGFELNRPRLLRIAYTMTGSLADAEDCVQEAWLRLRRFVDPSEVRDLAAWLTTTVSRLALDTLGSARVRREQYVGTWLPEPLVSDQSQDPADRVTLDESVSMALLVVLEKLTPAERTAFVLHDVFGVPFPEVARIVGRTPAAVRQLASRSRRRVEGTQPAAPPSADEQRELVAAFVAACDKGDLEGLLAVLDPNVVLRGDGGGKVRTLTQEVRQARRIAPMMIAQAEASDPLTLSAADVNGAPGLIFQDPTGEISVLAFTFDAGLITALDIIRNPDKLGHVSHPG